MVEYFGEQLAGFAFTGNGWVQSYGSRCVKPPIIFGDVPGREPMTVGWCALRPIAHAASGERHAHRTGDDSEWSFVRDDQPRRRHVPSDRAGDPR